MCEGRALIAVDCDGVEGACGGCEVLLVGLLTRLRSDHGRSCEQVNGSIMGAGLWLASPLSKPSTQTSMVSLFGMVPTGLEPSTGLLSPVGYLGVVSWSKG